METTTGFNSQKHEYNLFNTQKTKISFYCTIKRRIGTIKSQVYKSMKIFFKKELFTTRNLILIKICLCLKKDNIFFVCDLFKINECNHLTLFAFKRIKSFLCLLQGAISLIAIIIQKYWKTAIKITVFIFKSLVIKKSVFHCCQFIS